MLKVACSVIVPCIADSLLKSVVGSNPPCPERSIKVKCVTLLKSKVLTSSLKMVEYKSHGNFYISIMVLFTFKVG